MTCRGRVGGDSSIDDAEDLESPGVTLGRDEDKLMFKPLRSLSDAGCCEKRKLHCKDLAEITLSVRH